MSEGRVSDADDEFRDRLRKVRHKLGRRDEQLRRARTELVHLRAFSLDVFPDHPVPPELAGALRAIQDEHLTFLKDGQLSSLVSCVLETEASGREGLLVEAGTARGGSAIAMALAKAADRALHVHDVFGMIPPPSEADGEDVHLRYERIRAGEAQGSTPDEPYYGYRSDLLREVEESFARHGVPVDAHHVSLRQGLFQDTLVGDEPVALAHVDGDWYESTMTCLERLAPRLVPGGRIIVDDYYAWSGCARAVDEYTPRHPELRVEMRAKVHLVRIRD